MEKVFYYMMPQTGLPYDSRIGSNRDLAMFHILSRLFMSDIKDPSSGHIRCKIRMSNVLTVQNMRAKCINSAKCALQIY